MTDNDYRAALLRVAEHANVMRSVERDKPSVDEIATWILQSMDSTVTDLRAEIESLQRTLEAREQQIDPDSVRHWDAMRAERDRARAEIESLRRTLDETRKQLDPDSMRHWDAMRAERDRACTAVATINEHWNQTLDELRDAQRGLLEAWEWLADRHGCGEHADALERVSKAETVIATHAEWEPQHPEGARRFASEEIEQEIESVRVRSEALRQALLRAIPSFRKVVDQVDPELLPILENLARSFEK